MIGHHETSNTCPKSTMDGATFLILISWRRPELSFISLLFLTQTLTYKECSVSFPKPPSLSRNVPAGTFTPNCSVANVESPLLSQTRSEAATYLFTRTLRSLTRQAQICTSMRRRVLVVLHHTIAGARLVRSIFCSSQGLLLYLSQTKWLNRCTHANSDIHR